MNRFPSFHRSAATALILTCASLPAFAQANPPATVPQTPAQTPVPPSQMAPAEKVAPGAMTQAPTAAAQADKDMAAVLDKMKALGAKPLETLTVEQARSQPSPADAVKALMEEKGIKPSAKVTKKDATYPAGQGEQKARIYMTSSKAQDRPVIVYYHGGGWVIADLDTYEATPMALAEKTGAIVVSVEYRHAPEHKFPAAHDDAFAAYKWVVDNAANWGADPERIAVAGESAGGNLAANVAIKARDEGIETPIHMLLVYPVSGTDMTTPSYQKHAQAAPLSKAGMQWFVDKILAKPEDKESPLLNLTTKADLKDLPDATIITAEIDPLMSEGQTLAEKLKAAGVSVDYRNYTGVTHEFFGMAAVVKDAQDAQDRAANNLKRAFD